jgi:hypothetical protein
MSDVYNKHPKKEPSNSKPKEGTHPAENRNLFPEIKTVENGQ